MVIASFANASVDDLAQTLATKVEFAPARGVRLSTFHSLALRSLVRMTAGHPTVFIADDWEEENLIDRQLQISLGLKTIVKARKARRDYDARWCQTTDPSDWLDQNNRRDFQRAFDAVKGSFGFTTRGELTYLWWRRLANEPGASNNDLAVDFEHVLVDEYRDLNECEHEILELLAKRGVDVFVVGDPNQSIYSSMRHAHPELCESFADRFADSGTVTLNETYRCPDAVLEQARILMEGTPGYEGVPTISHREVRGEVTFVNFADETAEATGVAFVVNQMANTLPATESILVIAPNRRIGAMISSQLTALGLTHAWKASPKKTAVPNRSRIAKAFARLLSGAADSLAAATAILLYGGTTADRRSNLSGLVKVFETSRKNAHDVLTAGADLADPLASAVAKTKRRLDELTAMDVPAAIAALEKASGVAGLDKYLLPAHQRQRLEHLANEPEVDDADDGEHAAVPDPSRVTVTTYHSSKGLQADHVFLTAVEPVFFEDDSFSTPEERRRLLFVGMTRAETQLTVCYASRRYGPSRYMTPGGWPRRGPSMYVQALLKRLGKPALSGTDFVDRYRT